MESFISAAGILTDSAKFIQEVRNPATLAKRTRALLFASFALMAVYGAFMGAFGGAPQALSSAIKLPLLFVFTGAICFPTLYILNQFAGAKVTAAQYLALVFGAITVAALILIAFAPISAFFLMSSTNYQFFKLLNVAILAFAAFMGVRFLYAHALALSDPQSPTPSEAKGMNPQITDYRSQTTEALSTQELQFVIPSEGDDCAPESRDLSTQHPNPSVILSEGHVSGSKDLRTQHPTHLRATSHKPLDTFHVRRRILSFWVLLFAFVGSQLGWTLRPFFGSPGMKFEVVREVGGNFYADVAKSAKEVVTVEETAVASNQD